MTNEMCAICQVDFSFLSRITPTSTIKTPCRHRFHTECIIPALIADDRCPYCRKEASSGCHLQLKIAGLINKISIAYLQFSPLLPALSMLTAAYLGKISLNTAAKFCAGTLPGICFECRPAYLEATIRLARIGQEHDSKLQNEALSRKEMQTLWLRRNEEQEKATKIELQGLTVAIIGGGICTLAPNSRITALTLGAICLASCSLMIYSLYQDYKVSHVHQN